MNSKYQQLNKISNTSLEFHFDVSVEKKMILIILNLF